MDSAERAMSKTRYAGLAFMLGVVLNLAASFLYPGGFFIEYTDPSDYNATIAVMGEYANLAHVMTTVNIIGVLLMIGGLLRLITLGETNWVLGQPFLRFGIIVTSVEWSLALLALAERHFLVHLLQRSNVEGISAELAAQFQTLALNGYADMIGGFLGFLFILPFGSFLVGIGLAARFSTMNIYKLACYVLMLVGIVAFGTLTAAMQLPELDLQALLVLNNMNLTLGTLALFIIGLGMYTGRSELQPED